MNYDEELNDNHTIEACLIKVKDLLYQINADESEEMLYLDEPYTSNEDSIHQMTFTVALWYHSVLLNDDTIKNVPLFGMWVPRNEFIDIIDFFNIDK